MSSRVWLRRVYDAPTRNDGYRVLVDRRPEGEYVAFRIASSDGR